MLSEKIKSILSHADKKKLFITGAVLLAIIYRLVFAGGMGILGQKYELESSNINQESEFIDKKSQVSNQANQGGFSLDKEESKPKKIKVYITGAVASPGVICLDSDKRLDDAIRMAGGLLEKADLNRINLAMNLEDSQHYMIPYIGQDDSAGINQANQTNQGQAGMSPNNQSQSPNPSSSGKININTADQTKLEEIPGVGPVTAKKIIDYRQTSGGFKSIEDIKNVTGIGDKKFENMKDSIDIK